MSAQVHTSGFVQNQLTPVSNSHNVPQAYFPSESDWNLMLRWGESARKSGFLPASIKSAEAAAIIALKGRELGIPFMQAMAHISVIQGKPACSAELQLVLASRNVPGFRCDPIEVTDQKATIELSRTGKKSFRFTYSIEDAKKAELLAKENWRKWTKSMLYWRAVSMALKMYCPEGLMGMSHTPDELGKETDENGNVIETTSRKLGSNEGVKEFFTEEVADKIEDHKAKADRESLNRQLMKLYKPFMIKFPKTDFKEILKVKYGAEETKLITLEQLADFVLFMEQALSAQQEDSENDSSAHEESASKWFKEPKPGIEKTMEDSENMG